MCQLASWFGWKNGGGSSSISTTLHGSGKAILDFGNCNKDWRDMNYVSAYKNDIELASVGHSATHKVEFQFSDGDVIKIKAFGFAIIQFDDLKIELQGEFDLYKSKNIAAVSTEIAGFNLKTANDIFVYYYSTNIFYII